MLLYLIKLRTRNCRSAFNTTKFRLGYSATETFIKFQQTNGDCVLSRAQVFRWFTTFSEGRKLIKDEPQNGMSSTVEFSTHIIVHQFWPMNWEWENSAQKLFRKTFRKSKRMSEGKSALTFWNRLKMIPIFWNVSLLVTRLGRLNGTRKPSAKAWSSTFQPIQVLKKQEQASWKLNACKFVFSISRESSTKILGFTFTERFLKTFQKPCYIVILVNDVLASKNISIVHRPPYSHVLSPYDFSLFSREHILRYSKTFLKL